METGTFTHNSYRTKTLKTLISSQNLNNNNNNNIIFLLFLFVVVVGCLFVCFFFLTKLVLFRFLAWFSIYLNYIHVIFSCALVLGSTNISYISYYIPI